MALGIYIHIPFCKAKCLYCDFNSYANMENMKEPYVQALCREIQRFEAGREVDSLYIGGGTPTTLSIGQLETIIQTVKQHFRLVENCEVTIECNPATMGREGFQALYGLGVNRLSIGLQSANDAELRRLGRIHTLVDFANCFADARAAGFENLSMDLMHGLPGQTMEGWMKTLRVAMEFQPEHISCYGLKLEEGTPLYKQNPSLPDEDLAGDFYDACVSFLEEHGYHRYEISNFAKPEKESRHNLKYWRCEDFVGFGAGAYSCIQGARYSNVREIDAYCKRVEEEQETIFEQSILSREEQMSEFCFLGLRTTKGISVLEFQNRFGVSIEEHFADAIKKNLRRGTLLRVNDRLMIPSKYFYVSNSILVDFV